MKRSEFWDNIQVGGPDECWPWLRGRDADGYGQAYVEGERVRSHRMAWRMANGEILDELFVLHSCDNPPCCNPRHLSVGTHDDNMRDRRTRGRTVVSLGVANGMSKLTENEVIRIRERLEGGDKQTEIAKDFGVTQSLISHIKRGKVWTHA